MFWEAIPINDWLVKRSELSPNKIAFFDTDNNKKVTYNEFNQRTSAVAAFLNSYGLQKGDRVAILDFNSLFHLELLFALPRLGAIFLPLNFRLSSAELSGIIEDASPRILFHGPEWASTLKDLEPGKKETLFISTADAEKSIQNQKYTTLTDPNLDIDPESPWLLLYTGGTTGRPKGAMLSHRMVNWNALNTIISWSLIPEDVIVMSMPFFHTGGLNVFTLPLVKLGGTTVLMKNFDPQNYLQLMQKEKATIMFMVPTMYQLLAETREFAETDFSRVRICITGGSSCPENLYHLYWERNLSFKQGYGLTEAGPNCFALADSMIKEKIGSVGKAVFYGRAKAINEEGAEVLPGEIGELALNGPHLFSGYWGNRAATDEAFKDGWLLTGDLVKYDEDGYYYIVDRKKDMFISGGENVYPFEVESVLYKHPAVAEAAVVGIPHEKWGEVGKAYIVLQQGHSIEPAELIEHSKAYLARYKIPKEIVFKDSLPKSPAGKILKRSLPQ